MNSSMSRMPVLERVHLRRAARLAAGLHHVRDLIVDFEERKRPARLAAAAQLFRVLDAATKDRCPCRGRT